MRSMKVVNDSGRWCWNAIEQRMVMAQCWPRSSGTRTSSTLSSSPSGLCIRMARWTMPMASGMPTRDFPSRYRRTLVCDRHPCGRFQYLNAATTALLGDARDELLGLRMRDVFALEHSWTGEQIAQLYQARMNHW